jgi:hypothetical protein
MRMVADLRADAQFIAAYNTARRVNQNRVADRWVFGVERLLHTQGAKVLALHQTGSLVITLKSQSQRGEQMLALDGFGGLTGGVQRSLDCVLFHQCLLSVWRNIRDYFAGRMR